MITGVSDKYDMTKCCETTMADRLKMKYVNASMTSEIRLCHFLGRVMLGNNQS